MGARARWGADLPPIGLGLQVRLVPITGVTDQSFMPRAYQFQCPSLESFIVSYTENYNDYDSLTGPRSRPVNSGLTTVTFDTLTVGLNDVGHGYPWTIVDPAPLSYHGAFKHKDVDAQNAQTRAQQLRDVMRSKTPFQLIVGNPDLWTKPDLNMAATLRTLTVEERMGEEDTRYLNVGFVEHVDPALPSLPDPNMGTGRSLPTTLTIKTLPAGRTSLHGLAAYYYGDPSRWRPIAAANPFLKKLGASADIKRAFARSKHHRSVTVPRVARVV